MKKIIALLLALCMLLPVAALAEAPIVKIGQVECSPNGTQAFAVITVVLQDDVIIAAYIDEFQFMAADGSIAVPSSEGTLGKGFVPGLAAVAVFAGIIAWLCAKADSKQPVRR